jgi:mannose/fructose/N-acetylgalactosamine-specific phosphotransferase system component IIC
VKPSGYFERWRKAPLHVPLIAVFLVGYVLPWTVLIGGIVALAAWGWITDG